MIVVLIRTKIKYAKKIVIKLGSCTIINKKGKFNYKLINNILSQINHYSKQGKKIIIVSSGAVALGKSKLKKREDNNITNQYYASIGQTLLMNHYLNCSRKFKLTVSQLLLTHADVTVKNPNLVKLLESSKNSLTIINQNDPVSIEEITKKDNDSLAAHVARLIKADLLIILSNVDGIYRDINKKDVINTVTEVNKIINFVSNNKSTFGKGGMISKINSAKIAHPIPTIIANGYTKNILINIIKGTTTGTLIKLKGDKK